MYLKSYYEISAVILKIFPHILGSKKLDGTNEIIKYASLHRGFVSRETALFIFCQKCHISTN